MNNEYRNRLLGFYQSRKRMPTYSEMTALFGFKSKNAVYRLIEKLVDAGIVSKDSKGKLIPASGLSETPVLGSVKAGFPSLVEEDRETLDINEFLIEKKDKTFLVEVDGDSMIEAHIEEGDLVIAERTDQAKDGQIVIAEVDGEHTMKYFRKKGSKTWLEPANKKYSAIYPEESLNIQAIVRGVIRKY